ncbi:MAG: IS21 family transposase [Lactobacillaceae bacterium]|jgi:transposase|nr:IS21 family transposase [Lactobacillaceae bacterium]
MPAYNFIRHRGYTGSYNTVKRYAKQYKAEKVRRATIRIETTPGLSAQVDWKEDVTLHTKDGTAYTFTVFLFVLGYSRRSFIKLVTDRHQTTLFQALADAFEDIGGVPYEIWFDNMRQVVVHKGSFENKELSPRFEAFAHDAGFKPITHQAYRPQTKGKIESVAGVVKRHLQAYDYEYHDPTDFHGAIYEIWDNLNNQVSQAIDEEPMIRFLDEKEYLLPFNQALVQTHIDNRHYRKVSRESMIDYKRKKYSVPSQFIGKKVEIITTENELYIYYNGEVVRTHTIIPTDNQTRLSYNEDDVVQILRSDLKKDASDDEVTAFMREQMVDYDFMFSHEEGDGWRYDD